MMRWLYTIVFYCCLPFIVCRLLWRSIASPAYRQRWSERFAFYSSQKKLTSSIWLHTVSVGETVSAYPFARQLLTMYPQHTLVLTTTTPTGSAQVCRLFNDELKTQRVVHYYMPYDLPDCLQRFITCFQPQCAIFMETEVWPNTLTACHKKNIPTILLNARLSEKSFNKYQKINAFAKKTFSLFTHIIAQTKEDAERFKVLSSSTISVSGNLKSELTISSLLREKAKILHNKWSDDGKKMVLIAASTHEGEDEIILSAYQTLLLIHPLLLLVIVPRHPERFEKVTRLCEAGNWHVARHSQKNSVNENTQIIIGDSVGELMMFYGAADIAIIGGSFIAHGGHNMLEAAAWALPIVSGSSVYNFLNIAENMQAENALILVNGQKDLEKALEKMLADTDVRALLGNNAKRYLDQSGGALNKSIGVIKSLSLGGL